MLETDNILNVPIKYGQESVRSDIRTYGDITQMIWGKEGRVPKELKIGDEVVPVEASVSFPDAKVWNVSTHDPLGIVLRDALAEMWSADSYDTSLGVSRVDAVMAGRRNKINKAEAVPVSEQYYLSGSFFTFLAQRGEGICFDFYRRVVEEREGRSELERRDDDYEVVNMRKLWRGAKELGKEDANRYLQSLAEAGIKSAVYQMVVPQLGVDISMVKVGYFTEEADRAWSTVTEAVMSWIQIAREMGVDLPKEKLIFYEMYNLAEMPGKDYLSDSLSDLTESMAFSADKCVVMMPYCFPNIGANGILEMVVDKDELDATMRHEMTHRLDFFGEPSSSVLAEGIAVAMEYSGDFDLVREELRRGNDYMRVVTEFQMESLYELPPGGLRKVIGKVFGCSNKKAEALIKRFLKKINKFD